MPPDDADPWTARTRATLERYTLPLRHAVVTAMVRPRTAIPADDLADKFLATSTKRGMMLMVDLDDKCVRSRSLAVVDLQR